MEEIDVGIYRKNAEEVTVIQDAMLNYHEHYDGRFLANVKNDFNSALMACAGRSELWKGKFFTDGMGTLTMSIMTGMRYSNCLAHIENDETKEWVGLVAGTDPAGHSVLKLVGEVNSDESKKICEMFLASEVFRKYGYENSDMTPEKGLYEAKGLTSEALGRLSVKSALKSVNNITKEDIKEIESYIGENKEIEQLQKFVNDNREKFNTNGSLKSNDTITFILNEDKIEWIPTKVDGVFIQKFDVNNSPFLSLITINARSLGDRAGVNMSQVRKELVNNMEVLQKQKEALKKLVLRGQISLPNEEMAETMIAQEAGKHWLLPVIPLEQRVFQEINNRISQGSSVVSAFRQAHHKMGKDISDEERLNQTFDVVFDKIMHSTYSKDINWQNGVIPIYDGKDECAVIPSAKMFVVVKKLDRQVEGIDADKKYLLAGCPYPDDKTIHDFSVEELINIYKNGVRAVNEVSISKEHNSNCGDEKEFTDLVRDYAYETDKLKSYVNNVTYDEKRLIEAEMVLADEMERFDEKDKGWQRLLAENRFVSFDETIDLMVGIEKGKIEEYEKMSQKILHISEDKRMNHWEFGAVDLLAVEIMHYDTIRNESFVEVPTLENLMNRTPEEFRENLKHMPKTEEVQHLLNMGEYEFKSVVEELKSGLAKQKKDEELMASPVKEGEIEFTRLRPPYFEQEYTADKNPQDIATVLKENGWELVKGSNNVKSVAEDGDLMKKGDSVIAVALSPVSEKSSWFYYGSIHNMTDLEEVLGDKVEKTVAIPIERVTEEELNKHFEENKPVFEKKIMEVVERQSGKPSEVVIKASAGLSVPNFNTVDRERKAYAPTSAQKFAMNVAKELCENKKLRIDGLGRLSPLKRDIDVKFGQGMENKFSPKK